MTMGKPRGRKPQISTTSREVVALKRQVRVLLTGLTRLQSRLAMLDAYHAKVTTGLPAKRSASRKLGQPKPGRKVTGQRAALPAPESIQV